jgi:hypothetical protein
LNAQCYFILQCRLPEFETVEFWSIFGYTTVSTINANETVGSTVTFYSILPYNLSKREPR